jgi:hypothetical protein
LAENVLDGRWGPFFDSLTRRWQASFGGAELAAWVTVTAVLAGAAGYVALVAAGRAGPDAPVRERHRPTVAAAAGMAVLALAGLVANDSSFAVPATMLIVVVPVLVLRVLADPPVGAVSGTSDGRDGDRPAGQPVAVGAAPGVTPAGER